jgi:hypothetical protein
MTMTKLNIYYKYFFYFFSEVQIKIIKFNTIFNINSKLSLGCFYLFDILLNYHYKLFSRIIWVHCLIFELNEYINE